MVTLDELLDGTINDMSTDNPFLRWHQSFHDYPSHLHDLDDHDFHQHDQFERLKKYTPKKEHVNGNAPIIPWQDSDEVYEHYDK